jgi:SAM-dependent methyltransferase
MSSTIASSGEYGSFSIERGHWDGMLQILRFNWTFYFVAVVVCLSASLILILVPLSSVARLVLCTGVSCAVWWGLGSLLASHFIYDRSIYPLDWLAKSLRRTPVRWVNIHAGFDETTAPLAGIFGAHGMTSLDIFDPQVMTEASIRRARNPGSAATVTRRADFRCLPLENSSCDAVFLLFAAHEIRHRDKRRLFTGELARILKPAGEIILVEHLRDAANFMAFGPGCLHFLPRSQWLAFAEEAELELTLEKRVNPFVRLFVLRKPT